MPPRSTAPLCGLLLLALVTPATAQSSHPRGDEDACRPDVFRLCVAQIPDENAIVACLNAAVPQLSPACRAVIAPERVGSIAPKKRQAR